jgi:hypothetical protein
MIEVRCFTNLDQYTRVQWPTRMACRPMVGDMVAGANGAALCIICITHAVWPGTIDDRTKPRVYLQVELHNR